VEKKSKLSPQDARDIRCALDFIDHALRTLQESQFEGSGPLIEKLKEARRPLAELHEEYECSEQLRGIKREIEFHRRILERLEEAKRRLEETMEGGGKA